jgi:GNAT superfamily N-acetyltransferase
MSASWFPYHCQLTSYWHLLVLGVYPRHQRHGVATKLGQQVLDIAVKEEVPVTLESRSVEGKLLYAKLEFLVIDKRPVNDNLETVAMLCEPEGCKCQWLNFNDDGSAVVKSKHLSSL